MTTQNNNEFLEGDSDARTNFENIWNHPSELAPNRIKKNREYRERKNMENKDGISFETIWCDFMYMELRDWSAIIRRHTKTLANNSSGKKEEKMIEDVKVLMQEFYKEQLKERE